MKVGISTCMMQGGKSGVGQYVLALVRALLERPDCPELTLFILEQDQPLFSFARERAKQVLVRRHWRSPVPNVAWHQLFLPRQVQRAGIEIIHIPSYRRLLWSKPCGLVATIHDLAPFRVPNKYDPLRMFYGRVVARQLARRQDHIIAVSRQTAADIEKFFRIEPRRLSVILNGLDHTRFHPERAADRGTELARRWNLDRPFFLYTSRLEHPGKNHVRLIEAFARFKAATTSDWLLALAGTDWHGAPAIHQAADRSTARADIRFLGFVPDDDLPTLYRTADCLVYPSLFEGFGFPPIEAMACGCPVLSSTRGALAEVVADAAGILDPEDVPQMQDCLAKIVRDLPWREQLRQAGLKNAQRFHWTRNSDAVIACYRNVEKSNHRNV